MICWYSVDTRLYLLSLLFKEIESVCLPGGLYDGFVGIIANANTNKCSGRDTVYACFLLTLMWVNESHNTVLPLLPIFEISPHITG